VASLSQGRTAAAQCGLFTHKSVPVIFEPPCIFLQWLLRNTVFVIPNETSGYTHYTRIKKECYFQLWNI